MDNFINTSEIQSENGKLIQNLIKFIQSKWPLRIPEIFIRFIADIAKSSSVAGLLQVTSNKPLTILKKFYLEEINVRSPSQHENLSILNAQLPTFWPQLIEICELNKSEFLPESVKLIVLRILKIRRNTFKNSPQRYNEDYFPYQKEGIFKEDQTQFYPNHPLN